jgi:hypothetical protein
MDGRLAVWGVSDLMGIAGQRMPFGAQAPAIAQPQNHPILTLPKSFR